ncbi:hypothetical protein P153DRAFT_398985 [Dothidotthia symphoricarpi CBS 119687]|uniref:Uncharacterized protein n=1 Tax=Dothidotthia symphoricarpi CBS 119687 TaxID=1392245 RepID=A0A6A6A516_9PLEO|nr:uncharacterized protein P153DRAFT_398985 [Dothidotthia symphoricarpi CBS 119687]KAF2126900.1 hypothetical protein P153DRAFT_398985 [Dothidotthia symphoricarpi CBS 119687]
MAEGIGKSSEPLENTVFFGTSGHVDSRGEVEDKQNVLSNSLSLDGVTSGSCATSIVDRPLQADRTSSSYREVNGKDASTSPKTKNNEQSRTSRAQQIAPRALLLFVCLAYLAISFMTIDVGLGAISKHLVVRLDNAKLQLNAAMDDRFREKVLYQRLDAIMSTPLSRGFMEIYEECLVRGLQTANAQMPVPGWTDYADIRDQTIKWTTENCGRLLYSPHVMRPAVQHAIPMYWANLRYRSRLVAEKTLEFIRQRTDVALNWWYRKGYMDAAPIKKEGHLNVQDPPQPRTRVPFGFDLQCNPPTPCRLMYPSSQCQERVKKGGETLPPGSIGECSDKKKISEKDTARAHRRVANLTLLCTKIGKLIAMNALVLRFFLSMECSWALMYLLAAISTLNKTSLYTFKSGLAQFNVRKTFYQASEEAKYTIGTIIIQLCAWLAYAVVARFSCDEYHIACLAGMALVFAGLSQLTNFFFPIEQVEHIFQIVHVVKELYLVIRGRDPNEKPEDTVKSADAEGKITAVNAPRQPASPSTTIEEDIQAIRHQGGLSLASVSEFAIETDTESDTESGYTGGEDTDHEDTDSEGFVDVAGGVTPTVFGAASGWSVVDG